MNILTILQYVSYAIALLLVIALPIRKARFTKKHGGCELVLSRSTTYMYPLVIGLAFVMLLVLHFRDFSLFVMIILHATALLALEMSTRELLYRSKSGVYADCIIVEGRKITRDELYILPTLDYETEVDNTLEVVTEKRGTILLRFANEAERTEVVALLQTWQKK